MLAHFFLGVRPEGDAGGHVLWLLQPQHVVDVLLLQGLRQLLQGGLIGSLQVAEHNTKTAWPIQEVSEGHKRVQGALKLEMCLYRRTAQQQFHILVCYFHSLGSYRVAGRGQRKRLNSLLIKCNFLFPLEFCSVVSRFLTPGSQSSSPSPFSQL